MNMVRNNRRFIDTDSELLFCFGDDFFNQGAVPRQRSGAMGEVRSKNQMKWFFQNERPAFSPFANRKSAAMFFFGIEFGNELKLFHASAIVQRSSRGAVPFKGKRRNPVPPFG